MAPPVGVILFEFHQFNWFPKTRIPGLLRGTARVILRLAVVVENRLVTDGQRDRHRRDDSTYHAINAGAIKIDSGLACYSLSSFGLDSFKMYLMKISYKDFKTVATICITRSSAIAE